MKILYGVPGEGMGHATRSKVIISHLLKNHDVKIVSSSRAYDFLNKNFPGRAVKIEGFHIAYKDGSVSKMKTFNETLKSGPKNLWENFNKYREIVKVFMPDIIISDFESFSYYFGKYHKLPIVSIDNMQVIDRCRLEIKIPDDEKLNYTIAKNIIRLKVPNCRYYLVTTFFHPPVVKENTGFIPPILRDDIIQAKTTCEDHIVVYQTSTSQTNLIKILQNLPKEKFHVYGFNHDKKFDNVELKPFSEENFIHDLASAKAVISNGGFSLISESVYLKKPVCSFPIQKQFEQFVNAAYIDFMGYGKHLREFTGEGIKAFLYDVKKFQNKISNYKQDGNKETFARLDEVIGNL
ncbi:MAG: UDP-glucuronosyltransferase [Bacteroidia bacterium]|nr:UDP-glucuronosyltransferase [Bacteroidia bacterium]